MRMAMIVCVPGSLHRHCRSMHQSVLPMTKSVRYLRRASHCGEKIGYG
jgi:hypothetical protein